MCDMINYFLSQKLKQFENSEFNYIFLYKQKYPDFFKYLTIPLDMCGPPIPLTSYYYKEEFIEGGPKVMARVQTQDLMNIS